MDDFIKLIEESITLKDENLKITSESELINDIGMTSLDMMVVVMKIERTYNKKLRFEKLMNVKTVADLYAVAVE